MYDIYITRELSREIANKSVKVIEKINFNCLESTIKKFNEDLGKPTIINGYFVWENNSHRVEAIILDTNTKTKVDLKDFPTFSFV